MKNFLRAAFNITPLQILFILALAIARYLIINADLSIKMKDFLPFVVMGGLLLLVLSLGIAGVIENKEGAFENWEEKYRGSKKQIVVSAIVKWGFIIPTVGGYILFLCLMMSGSYFFVFAMLAGIIIRNIIEYFSKGNAEAVG